MSENLKSMLLCCFATVLISCSSTDGIYEVYAIDEKINIDGHATEEIWKGATLLADFKYPWQDVAAPKTTFKALHDEEHFYFYYYAEDSDLRFKESEDEEMNAVASDRVEIFVRSENESEPYYAFEIDPKGRMFDSKGEFGKYIDKEYDYPKAGIDYQGYVGDNHYTLEGRLHLQTLHDLGLIQEDGSIKMGLYRGEYFLDSNGEEKTYWISWVIPDSATPNFHIPSSFGTIKLL